MKKKRMILLTCAVVLVVLLGITAKSIDRDERPKVVVVLEGLDTEYWKIIESGASKAFRDLHIDGTVLAADSIYKTKAKMLRALLNQNPDALIVTPMQTNAIVPVLNEYKKKNIPVLFVDTEADWHGQTAYIGTDNATLGRKAGELLASMLQPGDKVALIGGISKNADERIKGAIETLEAAGIKFVKMQFEQVDDIGKVRNVMSAIMYTDKYQMNSDIKGVFATYDTLALKALKIIQEKGLQLPVVGADGIMDMVKTIKEGTLTATVTQNPYDMGYQSVENALKAIRGETVDKRIDSGVDIITNDNAKEKLEFLTQILK